MDFLLANPIWIFVILVGIGITIVAGTKYIEEYGLNKQLRLKQRSMRIKGDVVSSKGSLIGAVALAPTLVLLVTFFVVVNFAPKEYGQFVRFTSSDDVVDVYERFQTNVYGKQETGWRLFNESVDFEMGVPENDAVDAPTAGDEGSGSDNYSGVNNQVVGVDEMDNVITDGEFIYTMHGGQIQITKAFNTVTGIDDFSLIKTIEYAHDYEACDPIIQPQGMYARHDDDYFIVITSEYDNYYYNCVEYTDNVGYYWSMQGNAVHVYVYDKTDDFALVNEYSLSGYFTGTRKIGDNLFVITNEYLPLAYEDVNVDDYLPFNKVDGVQTTTKYEDIMYVDGTNPNTFTTFYGIDLSAAEVDMEVVLGDSGYNLYVSEENMYLVGSAYYFWGVDSILEDGPTYEHRTAIMKVGIEGYNVDFAGVGYVEGYTLNQFSMDEKDGYLRITTTTGWWGDEINNRLWVLDEELELVSVLEHLGEPGETIRSTRFVGDYAYLVTFEQTDPFYVINLIDPENPTVEGELHKENFATYLQPLSNDFMLGIGFATDENGFTIGLAIEIYNIRDKENPVLYDSAEFLYEDMGWAYSSVTYNHKDLLLDVSNGIIAFPFTSYGGEDYSYNSGIVMFDLDSEFHLSDSYHYITHQTDANENIYVYKALFIEDYLFTVSNHFVGVSELANPEVIIDTVDVFSEELYYHYYEDVLWMD